MLLFTYDHPKGVKKMGIDITFEEVSHETLMEILAGTRNRGGYKADLLTQDANSEPVIYKSFKGKEFNSVKIGYETNAKKLGFKVRCVKHPQNENVAIVVREDLLALAT